VRRGTGAVFCDLIRHMARKLKVQEPLIPEPSPRLVMWFIIGGVLIVTAVVAIQWMGTS